MDRDLFFKDHECCFTFPTLKDMKTFSTPEPRAPGPGHSDHPRGGDWKPASLPLENVKLNQLLWLCSEGISVSMDS